ncbi:type II secretion system major pseudopilin GspG [Kordiimonas pumila]|uniref:Type II secretion system core protein G n=1 Tax=Kordiimonas pumila TaxID=2161677 RepID=A0ABV7D788_9PROT|nr:type II secretion system major pseudopilin GspG [Kordiimonas pumila]
MKNIMMKRLRQMLKNARADDGFSLIELMVVIVIMGLLTTVVVINVMPSSDRAMVDKARVDISRLDQAVEMFRMEARRYPTTEEGVEVLTKAPKGSSLRSEGIIKDLPNDPWGNDYQYLYPGEHGTYDIFSYGADGRLGGEGLSADIGNWKQD